MRGSIVVLTVALCGLLVPAGASAAGPTAIGVDSEGVVYSGFASGGEIQRNAGRDGELLDPFGRAGTGPGEIAGEVLAIDVAPGSGGNVWVLDAGPRVQEFTRSGGFIRGVDLTPCEEPIDPLYRGGLDVDNGSVFVAHPCADQIYRFDRGTLSIDAIAGGYDGVAGISAQLYGSAPARTQRLYLSRPLAGEILEVDPRSLMPIDERDERGWPVDVFVDAFGVLFVADAARDEVRQYDSGGRLFRTLGRSGGSGGELVHPTALDVFDQYGEFAGNPFLADYGNARIQRWNPFGYTFWTARANGPGGGLAPAPGEEPDGGGTDPHGGSGEPGGDPGGAGARVTRPPRSAVPPQVSGEAEVGGELTCSEGEWAGDPEEFRWVWKRNGARIASGPTYAPQADDRGRGLTCQVVAINPLGSARAESDQVRVAGSAELPRRPGVSIAGGRFTSDPDVTLVISAPEGAHAVLVADTAEFREPRQFAVRSDRRYPWKLARGGGGSRRQVHVRFLGTGLDEARTHTAVGVVDRSNPRLGGARIVDARGPYGVVLSLRARDRGGAGLRKVQVRRDRNRGRVRTERYRRYVNLGTAKHARWARVLDAAGNASRWRRVRGA